MLATVWMYKLFGDEYGNSLYERVVSGVYSIMVYDPHLQLGPSFFYRYTCTCVTTPHQKVEYFHFHMKRHEKDLCPYVIFSYLYAYTSNTVVIASQVLIKF